MECDICCEQYNSTNRRPLFLPCQHTHCKTCLLQLRKDECPTCKQAFNGDVASLPTNLLVMRLAEEGNNNAGTSSNPGYTQKHAAASDSMPEIPAELTVPGPSTSRPAAAIAQEVSLIDLSGPPVPAQTQAITPVASTTTTTTTAVHHLEAASATLPRPHVAIQPDAVSIIDMPILPALVQPQAASLVTAIPTMAAHHSGAGSPTMPRLSVSVQPDASAPTMQRHPVPTRSGTSSGDAFRPPYVPEATAPSMPRPFVSMQPQDSASFMATPPGWVDTDTNVPVTSGPRGAGTSVPPGGSCTDDCGGTSSGSPVCGYTDTCKPGSSVPPYSAYSDACGGTSSGSPVCGYSEACGSTSSRPPVCFQPEACGPRASTLPGQVQAQTPGPDLSTPQEYAHFNVAIEDEYPVRPSCRFSFAWILYITLLAARCINIVADLMAVHELGKVSNQPAKVVRWLLLAFIFVAWFVSICVLAAKDVTNQFSCVNFQGFVNLLAALPVVGPVFEGIRAVLQSDKAWRRMYWSLVFQGILQALPGVFMYMTVIPDKGQLHSVLTFGLAASCIVTALGLFAVWFTILLVCFLPY